MAIFDDKVKLQWFWQKLGYHKRNLIVCNWGE